jgi:hypothetical protein
LCLDTADESSDTLDEQPKPTKKIDTADDTVTIEEMESFDRVIGILCTLFV